VWQAQGILHLREQKRVGFVAGLKTLASAKMNFAWQTQFCVTGAALHTTWHHFFVAGAVL